MLALILGLAVLLPPQRSDANVAQNASETFMNLQRQEDQAEAKQDVAALDRLLADGFFAVGPDGQAVSKAEYIDKFMPGAVVPSATFDYSEVTVHTYGDTAVVTYRVAIHYPAATSQFRIMVVWVKQNNSWRTATFSASPLMSRS